MKKKTLLAVRLISVLAITALMAVFIWRFFSESDLFSPKKQDLSNISSDVSDTDKHLPDQEPSVIPNQFVEETLSKKYIRITASTYLHKEDNAKSDIIVLMKKGTEAECLDESQNLYQVKSADNQIGWISKSSCEIFTKDVTVRHIPKLVSGDPVGMDGTVEGDGMNEILEKHRTIGASAAIIKDGKVYYHLEYGMADKEHKISVQENTKFRIASVSKVVTTMLAMAETDEGKLDLDEDLSTIFGFKFRNPSFSKTPVTTRLLLTHTSGFHDRDGMYEKTLRRVANSDFYYSSEPGTHFLYSNLNMGIAGAVVEKASGQHISQYARDHFFAPMGLDASYDASYLSDKSLVANCYSGGKLQRDNKTLTRRIERDNPGDRFQLGQGGVLISSVDLAKLFTLLINDGEYEGRRYLSKNAVEQMLTVQSVNTGHEFEQCLGIRRYKKMVENHDLYYHNGAYYGIFALMAIDPVDKSGVVVITSGAYSSRQSNTTFAVCDEILKYCYKEIL